MGMMTAAWEMEVIKLEKQLKEERAYSAKLRDALEKIGGQHMRNRVLNVLYCIEIAECALLLAKPGAGGSDG